MTEAARITLARIVTEAGLTNREVPDWEITPQEVAYVLTCDIAGGSRMSVPALQAIYKSKI